MSFITLAQDIDIASKKVSEAIDAQTIAADDVVLLKREQEQAMALVVAAYHEATSKVQEAQNQLKALSATMHGELVKMGLSTPAEVYKESPKTHEMSGKDMKALIMESKRITGNK